MSVTYCISLLEARLVILLAIGVLPGRRTHWGAYFLWLCPDTIMRYYGTCHVGSGPRPSGGRVRVSSEVLGDSQCSCNNICKHEMHSSEQMCWAHHVPQESRPTYAARLRLRGSPLGYSAAVASRTEDVGRSSEDVMTAAGMSLGLD